MEIGNNVGIANFILGKLLICTGPVHGTFRALHALIGGGNWNNGVHCGSRAVNCNNYPWNVNTNIGVRIQDEFIYGMISNSTSVGGFKGMTGKDVLLDDGVFEVTLIKKPRNPIELNEIIASLINLVDDTDMIYSFKSDEVEFMAREEVPWTLDGEFGGAHEEVIVKNICRAVDIMVPANK